MPGQIHQKLYYQLVKDFYVYQRTKHQLHNLQTCYFRYSGQAWLKPVKTILPACTKRRKLWCLSSWNKIIFIITFFHEILQRYCKFVILGTLSTPSHAHQKQWHQLVGNSDVYLQTKNQLDPSIFLEILHFTEFCYLMDQENFAK